MKTNHTFRSNTTVVDKEPLNNRVRGISTLLLITDKYNKTMRRLQHYRLP